MKPKVAFYWCASCGGCEETVVDLGESLLDVTAAVDVVLWPAALDYRYEDVIALPDGAIAACFINGAIRTSEQEEIARLLRRKSNTVIAFGACAAHGGVPALANLTTREAILDAAYHHSPTVVNPDGVEPGPHARFEGHAVPLPEFHTTVRRLEDVVTVDYVIPGCPPTPALLADAVGALLEGRLPPAGTVLAPDEALCASCARNDTKPDDLRIDRIRRVTELSVDPDRCFLAQGVLCMGPATRDGCGETCIGGNMPCTGCFGPTSGSRDQGGKMVASLGTLLRDATEESLAGLVDPAGTLYRYGMAASLLGAARDGEENA